MTPQVPTRTRTTDAHRKAVGVVERYVHVSYGAPLRVPDLCRLIGVSERGLRNAFHGVHGMSPTQWMRAERLKAARLALRHATDEATTVTAVATTYGFTELGRFAGTYKRMFGETPSATLQAAFRGDQTRFEEVSR